MPMSPATLTALRSLSGATPPDLHAAVQAYEDVYTGLGCDEPCCAACRVYTARLLDVERAFAACLLEHEQRLEAHEQRRRVLEQRITALEVLEEQYEALQDAHEDLLLEHADLQATYYVARRALRRAQKDHGTDEHSPAD